MQLRRRLVLCTAIVCGAVLLGACAAPVASSVHAASASQPATSCLVDSATAHLLPAPGATVTQNAQVNVFQGGGAVACAALSGHRVHAEFTAIQGGTVVARNTSDNLQTQHQLTVGYQYAAGATTTQLHFVLVVDGATKVNWTWSESCGAAANAHGQLDCYRAGQFLTLTTI
jgi:hypothetical protein